MNEPIYPLVFQIPSEYMYLDPQTPPTAPFRPMKTRILEDQA